MDRLFEKVHQSWILTASFFGIIIGALSSYQLSSPVFFSPVWLIISLLLIGVCLKGRYRYLLILAFTSGAIVGLWRSGGYQTGLGIYSDLIGKDILLEGRVIEDPDIGRGDTTVLRLDEIVISEQPLHGNIWVSLPKASDIKRSDTVKISGKLSQGFGSFAASIYRATVISVERPIPGDLALQFREWFSSGVRRSIIDPEASLGLGFLVGERRALPEKLDESLRATGLTHIVVASGYNLTVLVAASLRLFKKYSRFLTAYMSYGLTLGFMAVTGLSPSMSRAGLVTGLGILAWYYGRKFHPVTLISLAAAVTLLMNPSYGQNNLGWQLSFASFTGVLLVGPIVSSYFFDNTKDNIIRQIFIETSSAWLITVPLIVLAFGQFSNVAILANLLVLPLIPLAMLLTFIAGLVGTVVPALAWLAGFPASIVLNYMTKVIFFLGDLTWAKTELQLSTVGVTAYYLVFFSIIVYMWRKSGYNFMTGKSLD